MPRRAVNPIVEIAKALAKLEKASFGDILKEADISRQALDTHLKIMVSKKLILSEQDPKDKRKYLYWLNPNELVIITVDEAVELIEKEINRKLTAEERDSLRRALIEGFQKLIIESLKRVEYFDIKPVLLFILDFLCLGKYYNIKDNMLFELLKSADADKISKDIVKIVIGNMYPHIPISFAKDWINARKSKNLLLPITMGIAKLISKFFRSKS